MLFPVEKTEHTMRKNLILLVILTFLIIISLGFTFNDRQNFLKNSIYVGSSVCISCHEEIHSEIIKEWKESPHYNAMREVPENNSISESYGFEPPLEKKDILAIIGKRDSGYVFIGKDFRVYPQEGFKIKNPFPPHDEIGVKGQTLDASQKCFGCHATGYFVSQRKYIEPGVGCEACHGPGREHFDVGGSIETIINLSKLSPELNRMICGQCHSRGKDPSGAHPFPVMSDGKPFQPGKDLTLGFIDNQPITVTKGGEYSTFVNSPGLYSYQLCTDCHASHGKAGSPSMLVNPTSALCLKCHGDFLTGIVQVNEKVHWGAYKHTCWTCHEYAHVH